MRTVGLSILGALAGLLILAAPAPAHADTTIVVGGTGAPDASYIVDKIDGSTQVIWYPASILAPWYGDSVAIGAQQLQNAIDNTPGDVVVLGYSQGARIAGDVLSTPQRDGVTGLLVSDPRAAGHGVETFVPGLAGERPTDFTVPVTSVCAPGDGVCDWRPGDVLGSLWGYLTEHMSYWQW